LKNLKNIFILLPLVTLFSCQQNITLELPKYNPQVCVYCILEPGTYPQMYLNLSQSYYNYGDTTGGVRVIKNATVTITDVTANRVDKLFLDSGYITGNNDMVWYYKVNFASQIGHHYIANINYNSQIVTAETTIPPAVKIDTVTYERVFNQSTGRYDYSFHYLFHDIAGEANFYTAVSPISYSVNNFYTDFLSDIGHDGQQLEITTTANNLYPPLQLNAQVKTVTAAVEKYDTDVWTQDHSNGPLSAPVAIESNINGGLGIFGAIFGSPVYKFNIPK